MPRKITDGPTVTGTAVLASPPANSGGSPAGSSNPASVVFAAHPVLGETSTPSGENPAFLPASPPSSPASAPPRKPSRSKASPSAQNHVLSSREIRGLRRADHLATQGSIDKALARLQKLINEVPTSARPYLKIAALLRENKSPAEALPLLTQLVFRAPHLLFPREVLAELFLEAGRWDDAIVHGRILLEQSPRSLLARELLSAAYLQKGEFDRALLLTAEMIRLDPNDPGHHFKRGVLLQQKGQVGAAVLAFSRVLEMGGGDVDAADEARAALEMLDSHQIRQIITLAVEDVAFRFRLYRAPEETLAAKGFILSPTGLYALCQMRFDDLPAPPSGWRHLRYH